MHEPPCPLLPPLVVSVPVAPSPSLFFPRPSQCFRVPSVGAVAVPLCNTVLDPAWLTGREKRRGGRRCAATEPALPPRPPTTAPLPSLLDTAPRSPVLCSTSDQDLAYCTCSIPHSDALERRLARSPRGGPRRRLVPVPPQQGRQHRACTAPDQRLGRQAPRQRRRRHGPRLCRLAQALGEPSAPLPRPRRRLAARSDPVEEGHRARGTLQGRASGSRHAADGAGLLPSSASSLVRPAASSTSRSASLTSSSLLRTATGQEDRHLLRLADRHGRGLRHSHRQGGKGALRPLLARVRPRGVRPLLLSTSLYFTRATADSPTRAQLRLRQPGCRPGRLPRHLLPRHVWRGRADRQRRPAHGVPQGGPAVQQRRQARQPALRRLRPCVPLSLSLSSRSLSARADTWFPLHWSQSATRRTSTSTPWRATSTTA